MSFDPKRVNEYWERHDRTAEARAQRVEWARVNADDLWQLLSAVAENGCIQVNHPVAYGVIRRLVTARRVVGPCPKCGKEWSTCPCGKVDVVTGEARPGLDSVLGQIVYNEGGAIPPKGSTDDAKGIGWADITKQGEGHGQP